jgi:hypothetical protein
VQPIGHPAVKGKRSIMEVEEKSQTDEKVNGDKGSAEVPKSGSEKSEKADMSKYVGEAMEELGFKDKPEDDDSKSKGENEDSDKKSKTDDKKSVDAIRDESKVDDKGKEKDSHKVPANERIRGLVDENKTVSSERDAERDRAEKAEARIKELESGKDKPPPDKGEEKKAKEPNYDDLRKDLELVGWPDERIDDHVDLIKRSFAQEANVSKLMEREAARDVELEAEDAAKFRTDFTTNFRTVAKDFPKLYEIPEDEAKLPKIREEYDEKFEAAVLEQIPDNLLPDGFEEMSTEERMLQYLPFLAKPAVLKAVSSTLTAPLKESEKESRKLKKQEDLKKRRITEDDGNKARPTKRNMESYVKEAMTELGF